MAITRSQIARQLLAEGGVSLDDAKMMAPKGEFLAYINPKEAQMLKDAGGSGIMTPMGIPSFVEYGGAEATAGAAAGGEFGGGSPEETFGGGDNQPTQPTRMDKAKKIAVSTGSSIADVALRRAFPAYNILRGGQQALGLINQYREMTGREPITFTSGVTTQTPINTESDSDTQIVQPIMPLTPKLPTDIEPEKSDMAELEEFKQRFNLPEEFRLAKGGEVRQEYGLGKLVRKITKPIKKIFKSNVGKAALAGAAIYGLGGGTFFGRALPGIGTTGGFKFGNIPLNLFGQSVAGGAVPGTQFEGLLSKIGLSGGYGGGLKMPGGKVGAGILGASVLGGLAAAGEEEPSIDSLTNRISDETGIDVAQIRKEVQNAYAKGDLSSLAVKYPFLLPTSAAMADGGIARLGYEKGGSIMSLIEKARKNPTPESLRELQKIIPNAVIEFKLPGKEDRQLFRINEDAIEEFLKGRTGAADGGIARLGYADGEIVLDISDVNLDSKMKAAEKLSKETGMPIEKALEKIMADAFMEGVSIKRIKEEMVMPKRKPPKEVQKRKEKNFKKAKPALEKESADMVEDLIRSKKARGGLMDLGGNEMDLRGGGFVPIGAKEKADDVPARLSKNEFVFTADAVRAAGGGSVEKGAQKMYNTMKQLEDSIA